MGPKKKWRGREDRGDKWFGTQMSPIPLKHTHTKKERVYFGERERKKVKAI